MPSRIDHVIVAAADLEALEGIFARLGFHVTGGGTHPHLGTRNRIIALGEGYIELLGVADQEKASPVLVRRLAGTPAGWVGFALQSPEIASETGAMRARRVDARGPLPGRLVAPDGTARSWRVTMVGGADLWAAAEPLPFLIQHDAEGEEHRRQLAGAGGLAPHANGAVRLDTVYLAVCDSAASAAAFATAYGLGTAGAVQHDEYLSAETVALPLAENEERIVLAQPRGSGPVRRRLDEAGEGVCAMVVAVAERRAAEDMLRGQGIGYTVFGDTIWIDERATLGVPLALTSAQ